MTETKPKRTKPQTFQPEQTWFKIDRHYGSITPLPGVFYATRTTVKVKTGPGLFNDCTYYRSEVFPTYSEAVNALVEATDQLRKDAQAKIDAAKAEYDQADANFRAAVRSYQEKDKTPNPDAIIGTHGWVYFVTAAAINISKTIEVPQGDKLTEDSYRTSNLVNAQAFANILRKHGLTVAH